MDGRGVAGKTNVRDKRQKSWANGSPSIPVPGNTIHWAVALPPLSRLSIGSPDSVSVFSEPFCASSLLLYLLFLSLLHPSLYTLHCFILLSFLPQFQKIGEEANDGWIKAESKAPRFIHHRHTPICMLCTKCYSPTFLVLKTQAGLIISVDDWSIATLIHCTSSHAAVCVCVSQRSNALFGCSGQNNLRLTQSGGEDRSCNAVMWECAWVIESD